MNNQRLLFDKTKPIHHVSSDPDTQVEQFQKVGYAVYSNIRSSDNAKNQVDNFVSRIDTSKVPNFGLFKNQIQLAKIDRIPSVHCPDAIEADGISLHFDMGLPIIPTDDCATVYIITCLYFPLGEPPSATRTRLFCLPGIMSVRSLSPGILERHLIAYVDRAGDGWENYNSGRLACLGRLFDGMRGSTDLAYMRNHRIAEWFNRQANGHATDGSAAERQFFEDIGFPLEQFESTVHLNPGDLLIIDNTRVAHGRYGKRKAEEIFQLMYGVTQVDRPAIDGMRQNLINTLFISVN